MVQICKQTNKNTPNVDVCGQQEETDWSSWEEDDGDDEDDDEGDGDEGGGFCCSESQCWLKVVSLSDVFAAGV